MNGAQMDRQTIHYVCIRTSKGRVAQGLTVCTVLFQEPSSTYTVMALCLHTLAIL